MGKVGARSTDHHLILQIGEGAGRAGADLAGDAAEFDTRHRHPPPVRHHVDTDIDVIARQRPHEMHRQVDGRAGTETAVECRQRHDRGRIGSSGHRLPADHAAPGATAPDDPVPGRQPEQPALHVPVGRAWAVGWVPRGFTPTDSSAGISGRRTYTDGLAVFSVFLEDLEREIRPGEGLVRSGGMISYTRGMRLTSQPVLVTVIGEVPVNTARMVADSVGWVP